jgi:hypothetical protein
MNKLNLLQNFSKLNVSINGCLFIEFSMIISISWNIFWHTSFENPFRDGGNWKSLFLFQNQWFIPIATRSYSNATPNTELTLVEEKDGVRDIKLSHEKTR